MSKKIIAIGGPSGVGKSEVSKRLSETYKLAQYSVGALFREIAQNRGIDIYEMSKDTSEMAHIDRDITAQILTKIENVDGCVINGHGICLFLNGLSALKVLLYAPLEIRARRIAFRDKQDIEKVKLNIEQLENHTIKRFLTVYGKNLYDVENYDLAINSSKYSLDEIDNIICNVIEMKDLLK